MTISRKQLYDQVWQEPMCRLAQRYGISDVGLAKICRKHDIPIPARGYWAKKQAGHNPPQIALPNPSKELSIELPDARDNTFLPPGIDAAIAAERAKDAPVVVADNLRGSHTLVSAANQELQSAKTDEYGLIVPPENVALDIHVAKASIRRALLVMDAILKALEQRGYNVKPGPTVTLLGVSLRLGSLKRLRCSKKSRRSMTWKGTTPLATAASSRRRSLPGVSRFASIMVRDTGLLAAVRPGAMGANPDLKNASTASSPV